MKQEAPSVRAGRRSDNAAINERRPETTKPLVPSEPPVNYPPSRTGVP